MGPRFRLGFQVRLKRTDFPREGMPDIVRGEEQRWIVYNQYRIKSPLTWEEAVKVVDLDEVSRKLKDAFSGVGIPAEVVRMPKEMYMEEEYIAASVESGISRIYNPFTDAPEVFLEFASLGKNPEPDRGRILKFVHRYGDIKAFQIGPEEEAKGKSVVLWRPGSRVKDFHREARVAYAVLRLYEGIAGLKTETVREWVDHIVARWDELGLRDPHVECDLVQYNKCEQDGTAGIECEEECHLRPAVEKLITTFQDPLEAGAFLLLDIIFRRMHPEDLYVLPVVSVQHEYRQGRSVPRFYASWLIPTLLQAIWTLFYLRVTNQIQQEYRICPFCEEPIIKPRRNQVYHEGCRQAKFNQDKREVLKLWREGRSVEEIAEATGLELERIAKWVPKGKEGDNRQNHVKDLEE